jgi:glycosyltransferase involved in cell wall biosynthesis
MEPKRKPRVLFMVSQPFLQWRGSPIRVGFDVRAIAENGHDVDLLTLPIGEDQAIPGVRIIRVANPFGVKNIPIGPSGHKLCFDFLMLLKGIPLMLRNRYDVVHAVEDAGIVGWLLCRLNGAKLVFEKHSDPASHRDKPFKNFILSLYKAVETFTIRRADAVIGTGEGLVAQAKAVAPQVRAHYIFDIPSSLVEPDPVRSAAVRARLQQCPGDVLALYVGSFAVYQGIDLMFDSIPLALAKSGALRFIIIGGAPDEIAARRTWLAERGADGAVTFTGKVPPDELPDYIAAADILLSPRLSGINTPLKLLDYLKSGRAIVATDNSANRQILDESCAVIVPAVADAFAAGIAQLAEDSARRERIGKTGRGKIDQLFNFTEFKRRLKDCYDGLGL